MEKLIGHMLFLEGIPVVSSLDKITIGAAVPKQLDNDHAAEIGAIEALRSQVEQMTLQVFLTTQVAE